MRLVLASLFENPLKINLGEALGRDPQEQDVHREFTNFGRNFKFRPREVFSPRDEHQLIAILDRHQRGTIRVIGSKHAWSPLIQTEDVLIDMQHFDAIEIEDANGDYLVTVGAGCQIKKLVQVLNEHGLTTPSIGLITEQTVAGAIATGTHGSGKHSLSHYPTSMRIACYFEGKPQIVTITQGDELRSARCSLGCMGVVVAVTLPCVPQFFVSEQAAKCDAIEQCLSLESSTPLQQFFLIPHAWNYVVQRRTVHPTKTGSRSAWLYRIYWLLCLDVGLHVLIKLFAAWFRSRRLVALLFKRILPACVFPKWKAVDRSDRQLTMRHELFRHLELELFVIRSQVVEAARYLEDVLRLANDAAHELKPEHQQRLQAHGLLASVNRMQGIYCHHYPICFRRILPDDTLISMASGGDEDWFSISLITYTEPRECFYSLVTVLAETMWPLFGARIHWGKWFSLDLATVEAQYPSLPRFREICRKYDPKGVFANEFASVKLGLARSTDGDE